MRGTLDIIGRAIVEGSRYLPIRNRAAALASLAPPKKYDLQAKSIFDDFVRRWRYVKDPVGRELVTRGPKAVFELVMGGKSGSPGAGFGYGVGDCDCASVAIGAQLMAIGIPVRMAVMAPPGAPPGRLMSHIFIQGLIPEFGWVTVDPVVHPKHGFGYTPHYSRIAFFDLNGELMGKAGNAVNLHGFANTEETMETVPSVNRWQDYAGLGDYVEYESLPDFRKVGIAGFGCYAEQKGLMDCGDMNWGLAAEVIPDQRGLAWAPIMELAPKDYDFVKATGSPYHGMLALGDDADAYYWDQQLGFFRKLARRIKNGVKKVGRKIRKGVRAVARKAKKIAKKVLKKLPGGKYLLKLGEKLWKVSKKLVKPLMKIIGPLATKIAPVAALIPGWGTVIAAALATTGKIAKLMKKFKVKVKGKKGKVGKLKFKSDKQAKAFRKALKKEAKKEAAQMKRRKGAPSPPRKRRKRGKPMPAIAPMMRRRPGPSIARRPARPLAARRPVRRFKAARMMRRR